MHAPFFIPEIILPLIYPQFKKILSLTTHSSMHNSKGLSRTEDRYMSSFPYFVFFNRHFGITTTQKISDTCTCERYMSSSLYFVFYFFFL